MLYGNAAGGVVQVFTRSPGDKPEFSITGYTGSDDLFRTTTQYSEQRGPYGFVLDYATFRSDGFRDYSNTKRDHLNAKLEYKGEKGKTTFIANILENETEEPGSLTKALYKEDRYQAYTDSVFDQFGKDFKQGIFGVSGDYKLNQDTSLSYRAYYGKRDLDNPLSCQYDRIPDPHPAGTCKERFDFHTTANTVPSAISKTGFPFIDRTFYGFGLTATNRTSINQIPVEITAGLDADYVIDQRKAKENNKGKAVGPLGRKEENIAYNTDLFAQSQWFFNEQYTGLLGVRLARVALKVKDKYTDADGSGAKRYEGVSPVIGVTRHVSPTLNVFAQIGRGFETPTLNEVLYTPTLTNKNGSTNTFYKDLNAARSTQAEIGLKWRPSTNTKIDFAAFHAKTQDDIAPLRLLPPGSTWQNVDTRRYGIELSGLHLMSKNLALRGAATWIRAEYQDDFSTVLVPSGLCPDALKIKTVLCGVNSGNKMPGVPERRYFADLSWRSSGWLVKPSQSFTEAGVELHAVGKMYANSQNDEKVNSYETINLRLSHEFKNGPHRLTLLGRLDNATDKKYVGSVVTDQSNRRYYEPGAPRNWLFGIKYAVEL